MHRCPHCRRYKPQYEKIAEFFELNSAEINPRIAIMRIDCPNETVICNDFKIKSYPALKLGLSTDFAARKYDSLINVDKFDHTFKGTLKAIEDKLQVQFDSELIKKVEDGSFRQDPHLGRIVRPRSPRLVDISDIEGSTIKSWEYITDSKLLLQGLESRQALYDWINLVSLAHPSTRCQTGASLILKGIEELWTTSSNEPNIELTKMDICPGATFDGWTACKGSKEDSRGYTCGLWQLFHSLSVRIPDNSSNAGAMYLSAVKGFIRYFFQCETCRQHFLNYASEDDAISVNTKREAVLWLWRTHNRANKRLGQEEAEIPDTGDVEFPKVQWPIKQSCPPCHIESEEEDQWDEDEVYWYLEREYGFIALDKALGRYGVQSTSRNSGWSKAVILIVAVAMFVSLSLQSNTSYNMKKSHSRLL